MRAAAPPSACAVVELRRYRLRPGRRDDLVALFERELVETQEAVGMREPVHHARLAPTPRSLVRGRPPA
jgi:hypothetical protein